MFVTVAVIDRHQARSNPHLIRCLQVSLCNEPADFRSLNKILTASYERSNLEPSGVPTGQQRNLISRSHLVTVDDAHYLVSSHTTKRIWQDFRRNP